MMPLAPDARGDSSKELIITFYSPRRISPLNPLHQVKFAAYYFTNLAFCAKTQTGRGKFISNINDYLGLKKTASIVTIATRQ